MEQLRRGLDEATIARLFASAPNPETASLRLRRLTEDAGPAGLVRLFVLGEAVGVEQLPFPVDELESAVHGAIQRHVDDRSSPSRVTWLSSSISACTETVKSTGRLSAAHHSAAHAGSGCSELTAVVTSEVKEPASVARCGHGCPVIACA